MTERSRKHASMVMREALPGKQTRTGGRSNKMGVFGEGSRGVTFLQKGPPLEF